MTILPSSPGSKLSGFQKSAINAVSLFTKALSELNLVNSKIDSEASKTQEEIKQLQSFNDDLLKQKEANNKIISKISSIIEG